MELKFTKMEGCGNDYIYINCFEQEVQNPEELAIKLSNRNFGIGGDGVILICPSEVADAKMRMFNMDGSEGKMCGNATRCIGKYLYDNKMVDKKIVTLETLSGIKTLELFTESGYVEQVKVSMGAAGLTPKKIPVNLEGESVVDETLIIEEVEYKITCVSMGNPHCVVFCKDIENLELEKIGPKFEKHPIFPEGVNTEFVELVDDTHIKMRVWERGSGETLACGTGACAAVVASALNGHCKKGENVEVTLLGGKLIINYTDEEVLMTGPARKTFEGVVTI